MTTRTIQCHVAVYLIVTTIATAVVVGGLVVKTRMVDTLGQRKH
jgi:hypothetical protein